MERQRESQGDGGDELNVTILCISICLTVSPNIGTSCDSVLVEMSEQQPLFVFAAALLVVGPATSKRVHQISFCSVHHCVHLKVFSS